MASDVSVMYLYVRAGAAARAKRPQVGELLARVHATTPTRRRASVAEHMCGRAHVRPSTCRTCAAEHMCGRAHVLCARSPAAGGVRGVSPRQPPCLPAPAAGEHLRRASEATASGGGCWRPCARLSVDGVGRWAALASPPLACAHFARSGTNPPHPSGTSPARMKTGAGSAS
jgi:hypothetical protein